MESAESNRRVGQGESSDGQPSADLIGRVADEVYRLLLHDLKLERERRGVYGALPARGAGRSQRTGYAHRL